MVSFFKFLVWVTVDGLAWELVFVHVVDDYVSGIIDCVGHHKVLFNRSWKDSVTTVVNVFPNDVNSARSPGKELRDVSIETLESVSDVFVSGFMDSLKGTIDVLVDIFELGVKWNVIGIFGFH